MKTLLTLGAMVLGISALNAASPVQLDWWREARFGMFIHWGPVTLTGQEISWSRANSNTNCPNHGGTPVEVYDNLYKQFNPKSFNANDWAGLARSAGMKYVVLTAKHCDGFLLWDSKVDGYNITATPWRRDVCAELARAVRRQHLRLGWYFSPMDWRDPDFRTARNPAFLGRMRGELAELLGQYGPVDLLWFDWDGREPEYDQANAYSLVRKLQPKIIINNRLDLGPGDSDQNIKNAQASYYTPEQRVGAYDDQRPWETCMTICQQWSWKPDDKMKTLEECLRALVLCAGGDGNLLFNVGPMPSGEIEPRQVKRLKEMGAWLKKHGESIYKTRGGPWKPTRQIASTRRDRTVYLHLLGGARELVELPDIPRKVLRASVLHGGRLTAAQSDRKLRLTVPPDKRKPIDTVVKLELDGSAMDLPAQEITPALRVTASNVYRNQEAEYGPQMAFDGDNGTRWATDEGTRTAWIAVDFGSQKLIHGARIREAYAGRVQRFEIQYREGSEWKTVLTGAGLGTAFEGTFPAVQAREFRLNILSATQGPTIEEIEWF